jgi:hypothetical protein
MLHAFDFVSGVWSWVPERQPCIQVLRDGCDETVARCRRLAVWQLRGLP